MNQSKPNVVARKTPKQKRAELTVGAIFEATDQLLVEEGYDKLTTNKVAARAGVSIGSLYQYFPNKQALVFENMRRFFGNKLLLLSQHLDPSAAVNLADLIVQVVTAFVSSATANTSLHRVYFEQIPRVDDSPLVEFEGACKEVIGALLKLYPGQVRDHTDIPFFAYHCMEGVIHAMVRDLDPPPVQQIIDECVAMMQHQIMVKAR